MNRGCGKSKRSCTCIPRSVSRSLEPIELGLSTGAAALLRGAKKGPVVALRADIDAITQTEETGAEDASKNPGVMHGCGHDLHTAALLGAAMVLTEILNELSGSVLFIFQPAEEITSGARMMLKHGLFDLVRPDLIFGMHNVPEFPVRTVGLKRGALMSAKENFIIKLTGIGGHGGLPHKTVDPIVCAAAVIQSVQTIVSRNTDPRDAVVVSVCSINAGTPENLIVDRLTMTGSLRALSDDVLHAAKNRLTKIVASIAEAYGCGCEFGFEGGPPALINGEDIYKIAKAAALKVVGGGGLIDPEPSMGAEDFAVFMDHVPGFFYFTGSGSISRENFPWHSGRFQPDEGFLAVAAELYVQSVLSAAASCGKHEA
mgnify:CR=1 FL=1